MAEIMDALDRSAGTLALAMMDVHLRTILDQRSGGCNISRFYCNMKWRAKIVACFVDIGAVLNKQLAALRTRANGCVQKGSMFQVIRHGHNSCLEKELNVIMMISLQGGINWCFGCLIQAVVIGVPGNI
jgi:hypothetical protein